MQVLLWAQEHSEAELSVRGHRPTEEEVLFSASQHCPSDEVLVWFSHLFDYWLQKQKQMHLLIKK